MSKPQTKKRGRRIVQGGRSKATATRTIPHKQPQPWPVADPEREAAILAEDRKKAQLAAKLEDDRRKYPAPTIVDRAARAIRAMTEAAVLHGDAEVRDRAGDHAGAQADRIRAGLEQRRAVELAALPSPVIHGTGREVALATTGGDQLGCLFRETLETPTATSAAASRARLEQLAALGGKVLAQAADAAETVGAANSLEKMVAHEMAAAHALAMELLRDGAEMIRKRGKGQTRNNSEYNADEFHNAEGCRLIATATRLMGAAQGCLSTLARVRQGGRQVVTVQHVQVNDGGQAVVAGSVGTPGGRGLPPGEGERT